MNIKILIWNCRGIRNKKNELIQRSKNYDIIILTETKCHNRNEMYFSGNKTHFKESKGNSGGVAIIVKDYIEFEVINSWNNIGDCLDIYRC